MDLGGSELCAICLESLEGGDNETTICKHIFHKECLDACEENLIYSCPLCRMDLYSCLQFEEDFTKMSKFIENATNREVAIGYIMRKMDRIIVKQIEYIIEDSNNNFINISSSRRIGGEMFKYKYTQESGLIRILPVLERIW